MAVQDKYNRYQPDQRGFFDELITVDWKDYLDANWDYTRTFEVEQIFQKAKPKVVLNVGCGCGFHDQVMARQPGVDLVEGIDYSEQSIVRAESEYPHPKVIRRVADFRQWKPQRRYDLVVSISTIEHLDQPRALLSFMRSATQAGGWICVLTPNRLNLDNRLRLLRGKAPVLSDIMHYQEFTMRQLAKLGREENLIPVSKISHSISSTLIPKFSSLSLETRTSLGGRLRPLANIIGLIWRTANC